MIIFDLDDTLIDTTGCITPVKLEQALTTMVQQGLDVGDFGQALDTLKRLDSASESASQTLFEFLELVDADQKYFTLGQQEIYGELSSDIAIFPLEQAQEVLAELTEFHELALVSKGKTEQQLLKLKNAGIDSTFFSKIIISEGFDKKPHYKRVLEEFGFSPWQTLVCGDRIQRDLIPAKELGCITVHMQWGRGLSPVVAAQAKEVDFAIRKLDQLKEVITKILQVHHHNGADLTLFPHS